MFMSFTLHEALDTRWDSEILLNCARCVRKRLLRIIDLLYLANDIAFLSTHLLHQSLVFKANNSSSREPLDQAWQLCLQEALYSRRLRSRDTDDVCRSNYLESFCRAAASHVISQAC
jgi:hypothetical protein